jgi:hypothetical protein
MPQKALAVQQNRQRRSAALPQGEDRQGLRKLLNRWRQNTLHMRQHHRHRQRQLLQNDRQGFYLFRDEEEWVANFDNFIIILRLKK